MGGVGSKSLPISGRLNSRSLFKKLLLANILKFLVVLGLRRCTWAFSSCRERGLLFFAMCGLLLFQGTGSGHVASVAVVHGLSCPEACGIIQDQELNSCPVHCQADS